MIARSDTGTVAIVGGSDTWTHWPASADCDILGATNEANDNYEVMFLEYVTDITTEWLEGILYLVHQVDTAGQALCRVAINAIHMLRISQMSNVYPVQMCRRMMFPKSGFLGRVAKSRMGR